MFIIRTQGTTTIASGAKALDALIAHIETNNLDWNEAETRFQIIDRFFKDCLGWPIELIRLEQSQGRSYTDYEFGQPRQLICEAKKEGVTFDLPADATNKIVKDIPSIIALNGEVKNAIEQVQKYCTQRGVELAVVCNGHQLIAFLASRRDGVSPFEGHALVINGYHQLKTHFAQVWQLLSPAGIAEHRLSRFLTVGKSNYVPAKLSSNLINYPKYRYPSALQNSLRTLSDLLIIDILEQSEIKPQFYKECYSESGSLSQHSLISKTLLAARYALLFPQDEPSPLVSPVVSEKTHQINAEIMGEAISQRPIVLIGDVGVGKTSFIEHLMYVSADKEFKDAIQIHIDLGSRGALSTDLKLFVVNSIEKRLLEGYGIDINESSFVERMYAQDIKRFDSTIYGKYKDSNLALYTAEFLKLLDAKIKNKDEHLKQSFAFIAKERRKQIIVILDNSDQRDYDTQQQTFIIAQNIAKDWQTVVFVAVRPNTFNVSKQSGALTAYPHRVFTIAPPRVDQVMEKRLRFALKLAEGKVHTKQLEGVGLKLGNITLVLKALIYSLGRNNDLVEFLSNITGGNIRSVIEFTSRFIGSPNVDAEKILEIMETQDKYVIPLHEFWKAALLGEYSHYDPESSLALNMFDINTPDPNEHFLVPLILAYLDHSGIHRTKEGFVSYETIVTEMQDNGFILSSIDSALRRITNKKLIETSERVTFDENAAWLEDNLSGNFRLSTTGAYHLKRWISNFAYLDAMVFDTPILDDSAKNALSTSLESLSIADRYQRAVIFKGYLSNKWHESNLVTEYFDWVEFETAGIMSFEKVRNAIGARR
jgi:GTPase SAR1 family protein